MVPVDGFVPPVPTCVVGIALVLQLQCPGPVGVLIPEMRGHEGPVLVALLAGVVWAVGRHGGAAGGADQRGLCRHSGLSITGHCQDSAQPLPHRHQCGRGPHGAPQRNLQVPPAAVAQRELHLDVLQ